MKLVIDNVYGEYMSRPVALTAELVEQHDGLVVCRSLSKVRGLLGARIGYAITSALYAARLRRRRPPYSINPLSAAAAGAALADRRTLTRNVTARAVLTERPDETGLRHLPTDANLMLIDLGDRRDQILVLRARGLRYRDGGRWQLPSMNRSMSSTRRAHRR